MELEAKGDIVMYVRSEYQPEPLFIRVLMLRGRMMAGCCTRRHSFTFQLNSSCLCLTHQLALRAHLTYHLICHLTH